MDLTLDDVRQLALELWLVQREATALRAENEQLRAQLLTAPGQAEPGGD